MPQRIDITKPFFSYLTEQVTFPSASVSDTSVTGQPLQGDLAAWARELPLIAHTCEPSGLAILWNNLKCPKTMVWVQGGEHSYVPPEYEGRDTIRKQGVSKR